MFSSYNRWFSNVFDCIISDTSSFISISFNPIKLTPIPIPHKKIDAKNKIIKIFTGTFLFMTKYIIASNINTLSMIAPIMLISTPIKIKEYLLKNREITIKEEMSEEPVVEAQVEEKAEAPVQE